ncbi:MAG TPA: hypothetical protein VHP61_00360, partial [Acidobacteriota bacterium]|nr:hypothetical protein [Acidobacteriota bacterium]
FGTEPTTAVAYFLDDNFQKRSEPGGTWTLGDKTLEMVVKTKVPVSRIVVRLTNNPRQGNHIRVTVDGKTRKVFLQPLEKAVLEFDVGKGFKIEDNYLHRLKIGASKGSLPYFEQEASTDRRYLGVFFELDFVPLGGDKLELDPAQRGK